VHEREVCFAAGSWQHGYGATLVEHWNGKRWTVVTSANPRGSRSASCRASRARARAVCVAAGTFAIGARPAHADRAVERHRWTLQPSPDPPKAMNSSLTGVSCVGTTRCLAVGTYLTNKFGNPAAGFSQHRS
jgi:hypothetical protein